MRRGFRRNGSIKELYNQDKAMKNYSEVNLIIFIIFRSHTLASASRSIYNFIARNPCVIGLKYVFIDLTMTLSLEEAQAWGIGMFIGIAIERSCSGLALALSLAFRELE